MPHPSPYAGKPSPATTPAAPPSTSSKAPASRERRSRSRHRQLILEAACNEFAAKGFSACQTLDIALRAGVPKANLYYYFHTKENLYAEVLEPLRAPLQQASSLLSREVAPATALAAYIAARLQIVQAYPLRSKIFCSELLHGAQQLPEAWCNELHACNQDEIACLRHWMARGLIQAVAPEHLLLFIGSATQTYPTLGWQIALIRGKDGPHEQDIEAVAATLTRMVLAGAVAPPRGVVRQPGRALAT
ncbi:TetR family transcriptional regulator C-terminal domain-containing protein [Pseudomonas sp. MPFS]|uniref:TetR/AcrR family transcriptional regulator n=1 Tax=Pseudomonas sp. MPFS TaxID=2795724 RepID=UPI001F13B134|nr:TetR/AcrR family transcriptional regulator [Pseudomonas sp. MPFS]UMZ14296.1 TetR family transcriptional regulator C-terminal domain-containing protein [Pseudomonas sp. MPFS]